LWAENGPLWGAFWGRKGKENKTFLFCGGTEKIQKKKGYRECSGGWLGLPMPIPYPHTLFKYIKIKLLNSQNLLANKFKFIFILKK